MKRMYLAVLVAAIALGGSSRANERKRGHQAGGLFCVAYAPEEGLEPPTRRLTVACSTS